MTSRNPDGTEDFPSPVTPTSPTARFAQHAGGIWRRSCGYRPGHATRPVSADLSTQGLTTASPAR
jgi:hypothetical protein